MAELARALGRAMHRPAALAVPAFALRAVFGEGLARVLLTGQRAVPTALLRAGFAFEHPGIDEALRQLASELR
jgi:NAD dependent epimerase/dehydratase family enzyme